MQGNTDKPISLLKDDEFQIEPYVKGLAEFIEECDTPMTIAVQGDWGCGKTSMMNMVGSHLEEKNIASVWFNTWQFSQFNMDEQLAVTFLQHLIHKISGYISNKDIKGKVFDKFGPILQRITVGMTKQFVGADFGDMIDDLIKKDKRDIIDEISELKANFQELIKEATSAEKRRIVVFVDDLDRLQPVRAVELLEIMKLFMDCENCVFVMAIDTSVVFQGIREKYGNDMPDEKAQSFFDKMIQMPFKMPVAYYRLNEMMARLLDFLQDESLSEEDKKEYIQLFKKVTGGNPRSLKRLANSILLTEKVAEKKGIYNQNQTNVKMAIRRVWVILACLQLKYETVYNFFVNDMDYHRLSGILALNVNKWTQGHKGQKMIEALVDMGMPKVEVQDSLVLCDVLVQYHAALMNYINCLHSQGVAQNTAILRLMEIITLNDILDNGKEERKGMEETPETAHAVLSHEENPVPEDYAAYLYAGMRDCGEYKKVYDILVSNGIHVPLKWIDKGDCDTELDSYRRSEQTIDDSGLFKRIDALLDGYQNRSKKVVDDYMGNPEDCVTYEGKGSFSFDYNEVKREGSIRCTIKYKRKERCLVLDAETCNIMPTKETDDFVDNLTLMYEEVQDKYSNKLIPILKNEISTNRNQDGSITKLTISNFPILNEKLADVIIDYFKYVFQNIEKLNVKDKPDFLINGIMDAIGEMTKR